MNGKSKVRDIRSRLHPSLVIILVRLLGSGHRIVYDYIIIIIVHIDDFINSLERVP